MEQEIKLWIQEMNRMKINTRSDFELTTAYEAIGYLQNELNKIQNGMQGPSYKEISTLQSLMNKLATIQSQTREQYIFSACQNIRSYINEQLMKLQMMANEYNESLENSENAKAFR